MSLAGAKWAGQGGGRQAGRQDEQPGQAAPSMETDPKELLRSAKKQIACDIRSTKKVEEK